jgi:hypothetical protein
MKAEFKVTHTIVAELEYDEVLLIRALTQNCLHSGEETSEEYKTRKSIFDAMDHIRYLVENPL